MSGVEVLRKIEIELREKVGQQQQRITELEEEIEDAKGGNDKCSWSELNARWRKTIADNERLNTQISEWRHRDYVTTRELNLCRERIAELEAENARLCLNHNTDIMQRLKAQSDENEKVTTALRAEVTLLRI